MRPLRLRLTGLALLSALSLAACLSADPAVVARAVEATLTAVSGAPTATPIVIVVTVVKTSAPLPSATLAATPTPTEAALMAAPTATATPPAAGLTPPAGEPLFADDFTQPSGWTLGEDAVQRTALTDGRLAFTIKESDQFRFIYNSTRRAADFYAELTGVAPACQFRDRYGLLFRVQDSVDYYQFDVDCDGRFRLARVADGQLTALQDWTAAAAIRIGPGAVNTLAVRASGETLTAAVNGTLVVETRDTSFREGGFGLVAGSGSAGGFTVALDDFRVWDLP